VDAADADPRLFPRIDGLSPLEARERLGSSHTEGTALAYWVTAIRETFEETGVLVFSGPEGGGPGLPELESARSDLLEGRRGFLQILEELELKLDGGALEYNGHWLTPECEPRRYDTRFFATSVDTCVQVTLYKREMVDALWITPEEALARNRGGTLRLVFPTLYTLKELEPFESPEQALAYFRGQRVPRRLPRPQRAQGGVRFLLSE
jgi:8-oxo-dGTP pyrophosphatase MutT (NUDIX family)